jgi:multidrug efflux system membrane fusion protein
MNNTTPSLCARFGQRPTTNGQRLLALATLLSIVLLAACGKQESASANTAVMPAAPVTVATAVQQPVPLEIDAIGNVQAYNTVQVRSMVDGVLERVLIQQGQDVRAGQLLFQLDKRPFEATLAQTKGILAKDEANAHNNQVNAERYQALLKEGVIAPQAAEQQTTQAQADAAAVQADRAAVQTATVNLGYTDIKSPIDGRAGAILINLGNNIKANDVNPLITINQIMPIYVQFTIPESDLAAVRAHGSKGLQVRAFMPNDPTPTVGTLTFIDNAVDPTTGTIKLMGTFPNRDRCLWPGEFVNVQLVLGTEQHATVIPSVAVQSSQQGSYVFTVKHDGTANMQPVTVARTYRQLAVIGSGVVPGDTVVVDGVYRVIPNAKVDITKTVAVTAGPAQMAQAPAAGAAPRGTQPQATTATSTAQPKQSAPGQAKRSAQQRQGSKP